MERIIKKHFNIIYLLVIICAIAMYGAIIGGEKIWADEAYTFAIIKHSYNELWHITAADVHPPLYYILLKLCIEPFGYSLKAAKIFSIIPYLLILAMGGRQIRKLLGEETAVLFMGLFLIFPFSLGHSIEVRMYSQAMLFVFFNAIYAYKCYYEENKVNWLFFVLMGVGAAYTHYFALVSVVIIYLILGIFIWLKKKADCGYWIGAIIGSIVLYLPWLSFFIKQLIYKVNHEYWIGTITIRTVIEYVKSIFGVEAVNLSALFVSATYLVTFFCIFLSKNREIIIKGLCMLAVPIGTVIIGIAVSVLVRPIFIIRYVIPAVPLLILFLAYAISDMRNEIIITIILTVNIMVGLGHYADFYSQEYIMEDNFLNSEFVNKYKECEAIIIATGSAGGTEHTSYVFSYYENEKDIYVDSEITQYNPNKNHVYIDSFEEQNFDSVLLLVGEDLKDYFYEDKYEKSYEGTVNENGHVLDVYILTKR